MLAVDIRAAENVFVVTPDGAITVDDIAGFNDRINTYINTHDQVPNLVVHASSLPHWKNFHALAAHFKFIKNHHTIVQKVAIVSDSKLLWLARIFVDHFTGAKVRRFPETAFDDAVGWVQMEDDHPGELVAIEGLPDDVIAFDAKGLITAQDYRNTLVPLVKTKLKAHDKLKLLFVVGDWFDGYSAGALWDDARFGVSHFTTFSKMALVSDVEWVRHSAKLFGPLMPTEVMVFHNSEIADAKSWISG